MVTRPTLREYQQHAVAAIHKSFETKDKTILVMATGLGKCLGPGTLVMMYDGGLVPVEQVIEGDLLMGPDSRPRRVQGTTHGHGQMFEIRPEKGDPWVCNWCHVLTLKHTETGKVIDIPLDEYLQKTKNFRHLHKQFSTKVDFAPASSLPVDPYVFGLWLGDGSKELDCFQVTTLDPEVVSALESFARAWGHQVVKYHYGDKCPRYAVTRGKDGKNVSSMLLRTMRELWRNKDIPKEYLTASRLDRLNLLAGLLDSDGHLHEGNFEIAQRNVAIADNICFLARSLGFKVTRSVKTVNGTDYQRMYIIGDFSVVPNRIARKKANTRGINKDPLRTGFTVHPLGHGEYYGFELDGDGRFLLGDFTVTHNTQVGCSVAEDYLSKGRILWLSHRKELVQQGADRLHLVTGEQVDLEMAEFWASNRSRVVSASLDSIRTRLDRWPPDHFALLVFDECFPAGTLVDGRPIETIRLGDEVSSVDHSDGLVKPRPVVRIFKKLCSSMYRLLYGASEVVCTGNHPVFVKGRGYVEAKNLKPGDVLCVRGAVHPRAGLLPGAKEDLLGKVSRKALIGDYGAHEHHPRFGSHEDQQPDASWRQPGARYGYASSHGPQASYPRRKRDRCNGGGESHIGGAGLANERCCSNEHEARERLSGSLQDRCWQPRAEGWDRGGRLQSSGPSQEGPGQEEGGLLTWVRLDHLESVEPSSPGGDWVYNLEVEGSHTYFANDLLVHNCHHALAKSYRKVLDHFNCKKLGMTATPDRGDEKALGQCFEDVAGVWDIVDGVNGGYLVPIQGCSVRVDEVDLSNIGKTAGDLAAGELDTEMAQHVEGIVAKTLELQPGRQGIWFFPGVKSAELACDRINALGEPCAFVYAETPKEERDEIMRGFKSGRYSHLTNVGIATEGFDAPNADMVVIGRPTLSRALYAQMVGRGLRVLPGTVDGVDDSVLRRERVAASAKPHCVVVDFAGNCGRHTLVTPEDLLGGDYTEEEVKLAKKVAKEAPGQDVLANLEAARKELKAMMARLQSKVKATVQSFDPFSILHSTPPDPGMERFREDMSPYQADKLAKFRVKPDQMKGLSKLEAQKLIGTLERRQKLGLCSLNQLAVLQKHCDPPVNLPFRQASKAMQYLADSGWKPDKEVLQAMVARK